MNQPRRLVAPPLLAAGLIHVRADVDETMMMENQTERRTIKRVRPGVVSGVRANASGGYVAQCTCGWKGPDRDGVTHAQGDLSSHLGDPTHGGRI